MDPGVLWRSVGQGTHFRASVGPIPTTARPTSIELAEMFERVARSLADRGDVAATLAGIVDLAVTNIEGCECAGISALRGRVISSPVTSNAVPRIVDEIQVEVDEGPCIDALRQHSVFQTGNLAAEKRWPLFSERAYRETGILSILAIRLFVNHETLGALNLYSSALDAFDDTDVAVGSVFAAHAAVALSSAHRQSQLEQKVANRDLIGEAKGILMARSNIGEDEAFELLRRASQRLNSKLTSVARDVVHPVEGPRWDHDGEG